jgi:hypothetical protein
MLDDSPNDNAKALLLHKIGSYTTEFHNMMHGLFGQPDDRVEAVVTGWLTSDPGETELKKTSSMPRCRLRQTPLCPGRADRRRGR